MFGDRRADYTGMQNDSTVGEHRKVRLTMKDSDHDSADALDRYSRQILFDRFGPEAQRRLLDSRAVLIGCVHDFSALVISLRGKGMSIGKVAEGIIGPRAKTMFLLIIFFGVALAMGVFVFVISTLFCVELAPGVRIMHPRFGPGEVLAIQGFGQEAKADIEFEEVGRKKVLVAYAGLRPA